jgi:hypothetical protein
LTNGKKKLAVDGIRICSLRKVKFKEDKRGRGKGMYWYILRHPISAVPNFGLGYHVPSQIYELVTMHHPKFRAGISCTIPNSKLGYCVPSQGKYWYILAKIRTVVQDSGYVAS